MIKFHADHYFHIGSAHYRSGKPCQDYSLSGANDNVACAIVSDGCSTGRHTDVGSRVLALSTMQAIRDHVKASGGVLNTAVVSITSRQQQIISTSRLILGLDWVDMLATCGYVYLTQSGGFIHVQGDGVVALKYRDGHIKMSRYLWADNTPFYPSYGYDSLSNFVKAHGGDLDALRLSRTTILTRLDGTIAESEDKEFTLREGLNGVLIKLSLEELKRLEFIAVFSDGVTQVDNVDWKDAVINLLSFKSLEGEFAKRRMIRGIQEYRKIGKGPVDDIAYAVVRIEDMQDGERENER